MDKSLNKIYKSALKFLVPLNLEETYKIVVEEAIDLVDGDFGSVSMINHGRIERSYASTPALLKIHPRRKGHTFHVYKNQKPIILKRSKLTAAHSELEEMKIKSDILIPLVNKGRSIGVLTVLSKKKNFTKKDLALLQLYGPLVSLAIRKAQLYNDLDQALKTRDLFISLASHEFRTPLTSAYVYLQLQKRRMEKDKEPKSEWIDIVIHEIRRLNNLVDGLLQVNQINTGELNYNFSEIGLKEVVATSTRSFNIIHKRRKLEVIDNIRGSDIVLGDFEKLTQVFVNLLDNAGKHSPTNSIISIRTSATRRTLIIEIQDYGTGVAKKDLQKVFEPFYKVENNTKAGMGLGLYLTKQIIDKHRGEIFIESQPKDGTVVRVILPKVKYE